MKVKVFINSAGNNQERELLRSMYNGIYRNLEVENQNPSINKDLKKRQGVELCYDEKFSRCNVAVMYGSWKPERTKLHHIVRTSIAENSNCFICIESALLGRKVFTTNTHYRVGVNGFLNKSALFTEDRDYPNNRLTALGIEYPGWKKKNGTKIVIALQLPGDASLRHNDINDWCKDTVDTLRRFTDRPIEIRTHPAISEKGLEGHFSLLKALSFGEYNNIKFVDGKQISWEQQISDAYCVVAYTSGLAIDCVTKGIPVIASDEGNFTWSIAEKKLSNIENLNLASDIQVKKWLNNLAYCQWTVEEMESGKCWHHIQPLVKQVLEYNENSSVLPQHYSE